MSKTFRIILFIIIVFFGYGILNQMNKPTKKKRIECQEQTVTFESVLNKKLIPKAQELLLTNNYKITSHIEFSKVMPTQLGKYITIEEANALFDDAVLFKVPKVQATKLLVNYYIYENDKEDKNKKNKKAKEYAGYLMFEFVLDKQRVYKIQTDFMKHNASDIKERMQCVVQSLLTLQGEK